MKKNPCNSCWNQTRHNCPKSPMILVTEERWAESQTRIGCSCFTPFPPAPPKAPTPPAPPAPRTLDELNAWHRELDLIDIEMMEQDYLNGEIAAEEWDRRYEDHSETSERIPF